MCGMSALPYITAPGNIEKALRAIQSAATPSTVSQDFVKTILKIPGGSGNQVTSYLRKIGFVNADGSPSDIYKRFRNPTTAGRAAAEALGIGYKPLYVRNEYMHQLTDKELRGLVIEETGQGEDSSVVGLVLACIKAIKKFASWSAEQTETPPEAQLPVRIEPPSNRNGYDREQHVDGQQERKLGLNLSYTINLNLPASQDIAVFNAIFKSLKENLLKGSDD